ncbi:unnamed protein product [Brassica oleracea var. botrytis]|uniref:(rape) hypothetical protein n=1 Tax=Brassica napus TaxID=3708 RepID=A0A816J0H3_BRANA|nr:unnamed protein product [Brassica napus]
MCFSSFHSHCFGMIIDTMIWRSVYYSQYFLNVMLALTFPHVFHNTAVVSGSDVLCALVLYGSGALRLNLNNSTSHVVGGVQVNKKCSKCRWLLSHQHTSTKK